MSEDTKEAAEALLEEVFIALLHIADRHGITIKRMAELLPIAQVQAMRSQGMTQQDIMAASGYALKTVRKLLAADIPNDNYNRIERFVGSWMSDPNFPQTLPLNGGRFPNFQDVVFRYGREFTPGALQRILVEQALAEVQDEHITLTGRAVLGQSTTERLESGAISLGNFIHTVAHNLDGQNPPWLERRIWSHSIPPERIPIVREQTLSAALEFKEKIVDILSAEEDPEAMEQTDSSMAAGIGIYWFERG